MYVKQVEPITNVPTFRTFRTMGPYYNKNEPKMKNQVLMWSQYKHDHTIKFLVGCTLKGFISFVSKCYEDRVGDCFITNHCGFLNFLELGDVMLANEEFPNIRTDVEQKMQFLLCHHF